jgi:hypothetical protein
MNRDQGSNAKHHQLISTTNFRKSATKSSGMTARDWVRKYLDLADRAFRDDKGNDPTPNPA